jgi:hypothetical protein
VQATAAEDRLLARKASAWRGARNLLAQLMRRFSCSALLVASPSTVHGQRGADSIAFPPRRVAVTCHPGWRRSLWPKRWGGSREGTTPSPATRIATAPASARSILTDSGHGSREHRSAWIPSDQHTHSRRSTDVSPPANEGICRRFSPARSPASTESPRLTTLRSPCKAFLRPKPSGEAEPRFRYRSK